MLAKVSPASYRAIIAGQSCWGIFPLLLDRSMFLGSLAVTLSDHAAQGQNLQILKRRDRNVSTENAQIEPMDRAAIQPGDLPRPNGNTATRAQFDAKS
jgi:hypothetical protein